ncbi:hypothetical protein D3C83_57200 [compost metagenome]
MSRTMASWSAVTRATRSRGLRGSGGSPATQRSRSACAASRVIPGFTRPITGLMKPTPGRGRTGCGIQ